jgi:hypothetical protein
VVKNWNLVELTVNPEMIEVSMRAENIKGLSVTSAMRDNKFPIPQPLSTRTALSGPTVKLTVGVLLVTSFTYGKKIAGNLVDLEPI